MSQKGGGNVTKMSKNVTLLESAGLQWIPAEQVGECKVLKSVDTEEVPDEEPPAKQVST